jgi:uncharacterized protein YdeI (YjbR/CyaY-like superfamily)
MNNKDDLQILEFKTPEKFESWLSKNYTLTEGIWMRIYKKDSRVESVNYKNALDVALCYGWIDGIAKKFDEKSFIQKFTPRRAKSMWSKINIGHIERLTREGRMREPGLIEYEKAKADGRLAAAYDSPKSMTLPEDFLKEISKNKKAKEFFDTLKRTSLYAIGYRLQTAKKPETLEKRKKLIIEMLERGETFH